MSVTRVTLRLASIALLLISAVTHAQVVVSATQDAFINGKSTQRDRSFGAYSYIKVANSNMRHGFVQFDLSAITGPISSARLSFSVAEVQSDGIVDIRVVNAPWDENGITFNNAPDFGSPTGADLHVAAGDVGGTVTASISSIVRSWVDGSVENYGLALTTESGNVKFVSWEGGMAATLTIEQGRPPPPPTWPEVSCPCDEYYSRAVDRYISYGGILDLRSDWICDHIDDPDDGLEIETIATYGTETGTGYVSLYLDGSVIDLNYNCTAHVDNGVGFIYRRRLDSEGTDDGPPLTFDEAKACAASVHDFCEDLYQ